MAHKDNDLSDDLLWGCVAIADYIGLDLRKTYYLIESGKLPTRKLSHRVIVASKAELRAALGGK